MYFNLNTCADKQLMRQTECKIPVAYSALSRLEHFPLVVKLFVEQEKKKIKK